MIVILQDKTTAIDADLIKSVKINYAGGSTNLTATLKKSEGEEKIILGVYDSASDADKVFATFCEHWAGGYYLFQMPVSVEELHVKHSFFD